jgi:hypothetical protein
MGVVVENAKSYASGLGDAVKSAYSTWRVTSNNFGVLATIKKLRGGVGSGKPNTSNQRMGRYKRSSYGISFTDAVRTVIPSGEQVQLMGAKDSRQTAIKTDDEILLM